MESIFTFDLSSVCYFYRSFKLQAIQFLGKLKSKVIFTDKDSGYRIKSGMTIALLNIQNPPSIHLNNLPRHILRAI